MHVIRKAAFASIATWMHTLVARVAVRIIAFETPFAGRQSRNVTERIQFPSFELFAMRMLTLRVRAVIGQVVIVTQFSIFEDTDEWLGESQW